VSKVPKLRKVSEKSPKNSVLRSEGNGQIFFFVFLETKFDWFFSLVSWKNGTVGAVAGRRSGLSRFFCVQSRASF
jgi:hypothetical protein